MLVKGEKPHGKRMSEMRAAKLRLRAAYWQKISRVKRCEARASRLIGRFQAIRGRNGPY